jgi:hypothetical protein
MTEIGVVRCTAGAEQLPSTDGWYTLRRPLKHLYGYISNFFDNF